MFWLPIISIFVLFAVSSFPAAGRIRSWAAARWRAHVARVLTREMRRRAAGTGFTPDADFFPHGVGLALDRGRGLLFLAERDGGVMHSVLLPMSALRTVRGGEFGGDGVYDHFVDVTVQERGKPSWRLLCGEDSALAAEVEQVLVAVRP
jgi:hypothetical protein